MTERRALGVLAVGLTLWALISMGLVAHLKAQPVPSGRSAEVEVLQTSRAFCEQQLATLLEQARALQKEVDELKKQLAAKEAP